MDGENSEDIKVGDNVLYKETVPWKPTFLQRLFMPKLRKGMQIVAYIQEGAFLVSGITSDSETRKEKHNE